jgi:hypothetical protein
MRQSSLHWEQKTKNGDEKKSLVYLEVHMKPPSFRLVMETKPCFLFVQSSSQNVPIMFPKSLGPMCFERYSQ